jgi:hypothetical protein
VTLMPRHTYPLNMLRSAPTVAWARAERAEAEAITANSTAPGNFRRNMVSPFRDGENKKPASNVEAGCVKAESYTYSGPRPLREGVIDGDRIIAVSKGIGAHEANVERDSGPSSGSRVPE